MPLADEPAHPEPGPPGGETRLESLLPGSLSRQVFILALPMLGEQLINFCVGFVDTFLAGQVGKEATAAVGTGGCPSWFVTLGFALIGGILVRVPLAYLGGVVLGGGLIGAWCGMWADNFAKFLLGWARMLHGGWKRVEV